MSYQQTTPRLYSWIFKLTGGYGSYYWAVTSATEEEARKQVIADCDLYSRVELITRHPV